MTMAIVFTSMILILGVIVLIYKKKLRELNQNLQEFKKQMDESKGYIEEYELTISQLEEEMRKSSENKVYECIGSAYKDTVYGKYRDFVSRYTDTTLISVMRAITNKEDIGHNKYFLYCKMTGLRDGKPIICLEDPYFKIWTEPIYLSQEDTNTLVNRMLIIDLTCYKGKIQVTRIRRTHYNLYEHHLYSTIEPNNDVLEDMKENVIKFNAL